MRLIIISIICCLIGWSGFWWISANQLKLNIENWFSEDASNLIRDFDQLSVSGFPSRLDATINNTRVSSKNDFFSITAPLVQFLTLIYSRDLVIVTTKLPISITIGNSNFSLGGDLLKTSIEMDQDGHFKEVILTGNNFTLEDKNLFDQIIKELVIAYKVTNPVEKSQYRFHVGTKILPAGKPNQTITKISVDGEIILNEKNQPLSVKNGIIGISDLKVSVESGPIKYSLQGDIVFTERKNLAASFSIKVLDWEQLIAHIHNENMINAHQLKIIRAGLTFVASQTKSDKEPIKIPITIKTNIVSLGPLEIANLSSIVKYYAELFQSHLISFRPIFK